MRLFYFPKSYRSAHRGCFPRADFNSDLQNKAPMVKCRVESSHQKQKFHGKFVQTKSQQYRNAYEIQAK